MKLAIFYQETGEEGVIEYENGETLEQLLERAPEEWRYRYSETPPDYSSWSDEDWERDERRRERQHDWEY
jgi:hypothetical protein